MPSDSLAKHKRLLVFGFFGAFKGSDGDSRKQTVAISVCVLFRSARRTFAVFCRSLAASSRSVGNECIASMVAMNGDNPTISPMTDRSIPERSLRTARADRDSKTIRSQQKRRETAQTRPRRGFNKRPFGIIMSGKSHDRA